MIPTRPCVYFDRRNAERCTECGNTIALCLCMEVNDQAFERTTSEVGLFLREVWLARKTAPANSTLEELFAQIGLAAAQLVKNRDSGTPPDADIRRTFIRAGVLLVTLGALGTPEYTYPGE